MSFILPVAGILSQRGKLTGTTATDLLNLDRSVIVVSIEIVHTGAGTPVLTLQVTNGTTTWFKRNAEAVTTKQRVFLDNVFALSLNEKLQAVTDAVAGDFDYEVTYQIPDATARR